MVMVSHYMYLRQECSFETHSLQSFLSASLFGFLVKEQNFGLLSEQDIEKALCEERRIKN